MITCKRCKANIDRTAASEQFTIITIKHDGSDHCRSERYYLCDLCTYDLNKFMIIDEYGDPVYFPDKWYNKAKWNKGEEDDKTIKVRTRNS